MTREEAKEILGESATDESVKSFLDKYHAKENSTQKRIDELENQLKKYSDYDTIKQQLNDINVSKMTEQEKLEADKQATAEALRNAKIIYNTAKVKEILAGEKVDDKLIDKLVSDSEELSIASATALKDTLNALKEDVAKKTRESLVNVNDEPDMKNADSKKALSWEEMSYQQKLELKRTNPAEYERIRTAQ